MTTRRYDDVPKVVRGPGSPVEPLRRFMLIGDVHAEDERLEAALRVAAEQRVEALLCVGDVCDGVGDLDRAVWLLERHRVHVVRGNHDRWFCTDELRGLRPVQLREHHAEVERAVWGWPPVLEFATIEGPLLLCHAVGLDDFAHFKPSFDDDAILALEPFRELLDAARFRFLACGHGHEAMARRVESLVVLNAGTLKWDDDPVVGIVDLEQRALDLYDLDTPSRPWLRETLAVPAR